MDGNQRWSKKIGCSKYEAYQIGAKKLILLSKFIFKNYDISYISAFAISSHNLKRSRKTINILINLLDEFVDQYLCNSLKFSFNLIFIGDLSFLPNKIRMKLENINNTNKNINHNLVIFLNYSGRNEIVNSAKSIIFSNLNMNQHNLSKNLLTSNLPDPDILIRTGGYKRISDFMLFQLSFTELFFLKCLWPSITSTHIKRIINEYSKIERKFGIN